MIYNLRCANLNGMKKRSVIISFIIVTGLVMAACGRSDKSSETEVAEESTELQTIEFDTGTEEPVDALQDEEPAQTEEQAFEAPVIEETPEVTADGESTGTPEETAAPEESTESTSSDYSVEDISEKTLYTTDTVNMRMGPSSSDFDVVEMLAMGTQVTANGKVNGYKGDGKTWYRIKRSDGSTVFIIADYLSDKKPEPKPEETAKDNKSASEDAAKKAADEAAKKLAEENAKKAAEQTPAAPAGGTHNLNGLIVNDAEYRALLDTWRWATDGSDAEAEHFVLKHSAGDLEAVLKSKGLR